MNYFHAKGRGLPADLAKGLAAFLNSTLTDAFFRQFNGHTQVNAGDLRSLRYPSRQRLEFLGSQIGSTFPTQEKLDRRIEEELFGMTSADPILAKKRMEEALAVLKELDLPKEQTNERSALTLLALLGLTPAKSWAAASDPLIGIHSMLGFFKEHYGKEYAENTRETIRRQTAHQFIDAGLILLNPDKPDRPVNSPKACYQISPVPLKLLRQVGSKGWPASLAE